MTTPEQVLAGYDNSKESKQLIIKLKTLAQRYKKTGVNRENISGIVCKLMMEVNNLKAIPGPEKKELVIDLIYNLIEGLEGEEGDEDTEFEILLKTMVPPMIDSFSVMLKVSKACSCFGK